MEVELRAKIDKLDVIKKKLITFGAIFVSEKTLTDYYFGDLSLYQKLGRSFWIRIRVKDTNKIELAYKGPTNRDGVYEEYEQEVQNLEIITSILTKSGLENPITVYKKRATFKLNEITIELDEIKGKGTYIELEKITDNFDKKDLYKFMKKLSIPSKNIFEKGYITQFLSEEGSPYSKWVVN